MRKSKPLASPPELNYAGWPQSESAMEELQKSTSRQVARICAVVYWILAVLVVGAGVNARMHLPLQPMMDKDSSSFLYPALSKYEGGVLQLEQGRSYPYPAMLSLILRGFNDYKAIAFFQHLLGIFAGILAIVAWNRARLLIPSPALPEWLYRLIGLILALLVLVSSKSMIYEQLIRPEAVMPFFIMGTILLSIEFMRSRFIDYRLNAALVYGTALILSSSLLFVMKAIWGLNLLFASLPVVISLFWRGSRDLPGGLSGKGNGLIRGVLVIALPALLCTLLLFWPDRLLRERDTQGKFFLPTSLFSIHADIISDQLRDDIQKNETPYPTAFLSSVLESLSNKMEGPGASKMGSLDFNADYLLHVSPFFKEMSKELGGDDKMAAFCFYYYKRAFSKRPRQMGGKILNSMRVFYCSECPAYESEKNDTLIAERYEQTCGLFKTHLKVCTTSACSAYYNDCEKLAGSKVFIKASKVGRFFFKGLRAGYVPALLMTMALGVIILAFKLRSLGLFGALALLLFSFNFGMCLGVSVVHTLGIRRYVHCQFSFTVLAEFIALALILEAGAQLIRLLLKRRSDRLIDPKANQGAPLGV